MARALFITPNCCEEVKKNSTVFLRHSRFELYESKGQENIKPKWYCMTWDIKQNTFDRVQVTYCPHCNKKLPDVTKRKTKRTVCVITDGGFYCDTCGIILTECTCYPPEYAWKPI